MTAFFYPSRHQPKVSILIHNFDRAFHLRRCLNSITSQTFRPLEVIILDAGSNDDSEAVIAEYKSRMSELSIEFRSYSCPLMGVPSSRNLAAQFASGDILCFIDNDAILISRTTFEEVVRVYQETPRLSVISFQVLMENSPDLDPFSWIYRKTIKKWRNRQFQTFSFTGGAFCITKSSFRETGGFWEMLKYSREEEELALSLINRAQRIVYAPQIIIRHYPDPRGRMNVPERRFIELKNGILIYWKRFPIPACFLFILARLLSMSIKSFLKERKPPWYLLPAIKQAVQEWEAKHASRDPISYYAAWKYLLLHFKA